MTTDGECRRVVERASQEEVTVDYANDLDTKRYAFAMRPQTADQRYSVCHFMLLTLVLIPAAGMAQGFRTLPMTFAPGT